MIIRATEYSQPLIPWLAVALWVWTLAGSQPTLTPIWLRPPTTVGVTTLIRVYAKFGDIASMEVVNPTPCPELRRQISTDDLLPATARSLPTVRLCRMYSRREHPTRWTRHSYRSSIQRPRSPPDITMGCTPCHHAQLLSRSRVHYPTPTSPLVILLLLPRLLPQALANQSSCRSLSTAMHSHPPRMIMSRKNPLTFPMDPSPPASVQSHPSLTASRVSLADSTRNLGASMSTHPSSIRNRDANHSMHPVLLPRVVTR